VPGTCICKLKNLAEVAFYELYPENKIARQLRVKYSRSFRHYNANVKYTGDWMEFKLSSEWKPVSDEMKIGLIQSLLVKVFKDDKRTVNMDLYENFVKGIGEYRPATKSDLLLEESFKRVNEKYLHGFMEMPSLAWGQKSFSKLGCYTYADNTITISKVLAGEVELLDYVMFHELLHKKHKYTVKNNRSHHHTKAFRQEEACFMLSNADKKLSDFIRRKRLSGSCDATPGEEKKGLLERFFG
jgi:hypothetical protein